MNDKLDTGEIAEFLRLTRKYVTNRVTKSPDFPAPIVNRGRKMRLWLRTEVEAWARGGQSRPAMSSDDIR